MRTLVAIFPLVLLLGIVALFFLDLFIWRKWAREGKTIGVDERTGLPSLYNFSKDMQQVQTDPEKLKQVSQLFFLLPIIAFMMGGIGVAVLYFIVPRTQESILFGVFFFVFSLFFFLASFAAKTGKNLKNHPFVGQMVLWVLLAVLVGFGGPFILQRLSHGESWGFVTFFLGTFVIGTISSYMSARKKEAVAGQ